MWDDDWQAACRDRLGPSLGFPHAVSLPLYHPDYYSVPYRRSDHAGITAETASLVSVGQALTRALYGSDVTGCPSLLPEPTQWEEWHRNVKTPDRPTGDWREMRSPTDVRSN